MDVRSPTGEKFVLEQAINRGGEAQIWTVQHDPHLVAKLYHKPTAEHAAKVAAMIATPLSRAGAHPTVAWPLQMLYQQNRFVGYLMARAASSRPLFQFYNPARRQRLGLSHPWPRFLHRTAQNLAAAVELVHAHGHLIGDLNESNVLVTNAALVTLVDTDSFQIRSVPATPRPAQQTGTNPPYVIYRCGVGKAEYTAPELQGIDFKSVDRTPEHDNFALAVLIFSLLMEGFHPFAGVLTTPASVGRVDLYGIKHGLFPYGAGNATGQASGQLMVQPPPNAPVFAQLHPGLQDAFRRTFVTGHAQPGRRVSAKEWRTLLQEAGEALVSCRQNGTHVYSRHLRHCPTCPPPPPSPLQPQVLMQSAATVFTKAANGMPSSAQSLALAWRTSPWQATGHLVKQVVQLRQTGPQLALAWHQTQTQWQGVVQRTQGSLAEVPARWGAIQRAAMIHAHLLGNWWAGHLIGLPLAVLMTSLVYPLLAPDALLSDASSEQSMLIGALFSALLGASQSYTLRHGLLRWSYLRYMWMGLAALTGALWGAASFQLMGPAWLQVDAWPAQALLVTIIAGCFGATLGFFQSLLLRQQLRRAIDSRIWTITNGVSALLSVQGWLWGQGWLYAWHQQDFPDWQINGALGAMLGIAIGSLLSGSVLLWMLQGPQRHVSVSQFALNVVRWTLVPGQLRHRTVRWGRALLLLILFWLFLQMLSQMQSAAALVAPPLPPDLAPHIAPLIFRLTGY